MKCCPNVVQLLWLCGDSGSFCGFSAWQCGCPGWVRCWGGCTEGLGGSDVDLDDPEWDRFCQDFLLVYGSAMRSQTDPVVLVDGILTVLHALTGCGEYAD